MSDLANLEPLTDLSAIEAVVVLAAGAVAQRGEPVTLEVVATQLGMPAWVLRGLYEIRSLPDEPLEVP